MTMAMMMRNGNHSSSSNAKYNTGTRSGRKRSSQSSVSMQIKLMQRRFAAVPHARAHVVILVAAVVLFAITLSLALARRRGLGLRFNVNRTAANAFSLSFEWRGFGLGKATTTTAAADGGEDVVLKVLRGKESVALEFALVTDQDKMSRRESDDRRNLPRRWVSYLRRGELRLTRRHQNQQRAARFGHSRFLNDSSSSSSWAAAVPAAVAKDVVGMELEWRDDAPGVELWSRVNEDGRGMELSELAWFNGRLLSPDDRTGVLYEILSIQDDDYNNDNDDGSGGGRRRRRRKTEQHAAPRVAPREVLADGDGDVAKGFKGEWMVVKDGQLVVGGHGRERTDPYNGSIILSEDPLWVKILDDRHGSNDVQHEDWSAYYSVLRRAVGAEFPGYLLHEAVLWSERRREWVFLPRRYAPAPLRFEQRANEHRGWHVALVVDEAFVNVRAVQLDLPRSPERGFSSAKFVPGSNDNLVLAVRTVELEDTATLESFLSVFELSSGRVVLPERSIGFVKYEGVEFLP